MRLVRQLFVLAVCAALTVVPTPSPAGNGVVQVNGGGTGLFIDPSVTPTDMGLTTNFSVALKINADGTASGHFNCLIPGIVVVNGKYDTGTYDSDTGVATASGVAKIKFPSGDAITVEFENNFKAGGPGVGMFTLFETSGYFDVAPFIDTEVVVKGSIKIH